MVCSFLFWSYCPLERLWHICTHRASECSMASSPNSTDRPRVFVLFICSPNTISRGLAWILSSLYVLAAVHAFLVLSNWESSHSAVILFTKTICLVRFPNWEVILDLRESLRILMFPQYTPLKEVYQAVTLGRSDDQSNAVFCHYQTA